MNTKYYRFLYYPVTQGMIFSASIGAVNGKDGTQVLYLSNAAKEQEDFPIPAGTEHLHYLILADTEPQTMRCAQTLLETSSVDTILLPKTQEVFTLTAPGETAICEVIHKQEISLSDYVIKLFCRDNKLVVYFGSEGIYPSGNECVMNVKTFTPKLPCSMTVDAANLGCEMRCLLRQDITQCKRHNQRDETYFVDGHLLPGTADLSECLPELRTYLTEEWESIRFVGLPFGGSENGWQKELMETGTAGHHRYFIGTNDVSPAVLEAIGTQDTYGTFAFTGKESGLCISGCYAAR